MAHFLIKLLIAHTTALKCVRIKYPISGQSTERRLLSTDKNASKQFGERVSIFILSMLILTLTIAMDTDNHVVPSIAFVY